MTVATPNWAVWLNVRGEKFCQGMKANLLPKSAKNLTTASAIITRASKSRLCMGCNGFIEKGDLYGKSVSYSYSFCLNCCTIETGLYGEEADDLNLALDKKELGIKKP